MTQLWRVQQSYALLSLFLWAAVISLTAAAYILPFEQRQLGIDPSTPGVIAATLILLFAAVFGGLFLFGVVYDRYLRLYRDQLDVAYDRNPYAREKLMVKEILMWRHMFLPGMRARTLVPDAQREVAFMEKWIQKSLAQDANIRRSVEEAERWISDTSARGS